MSDEYVCGHGYHSSFPFVHQLGPVTSTGRGEIVPVCHPVLTKVES